MCVRGWLCVCVGVFKLTSLREKSLTCRGREHRDAAATVDASAVRETDWLCTRTLSHRRIHTAAAAAITVPSNHSSGKRYHRHIYTPPAIPSAPTNRPARHRGMDGRKKGERARTEEEKKHGTVCATARSQHHLRMQEKITAGAPHARCGSRCSHAHTHTNTRLCCAANYSLQRRRRRRRRAATAAAAVTAGQIIIDACVCS